MDLEEWEYLSEDGFIIDQLHHQNRKGKRVIPRETPSSLQPNSLIDSKGVSLSPNLVIHVPVEFDFQIPESFHSPPPATKESISPGNATTPLPVFGSEQEQETVSSQVFFKKARGNEFADMKLDSPKSVNRGLVPQIDLGMPQFEEKEKKTSKGSFDWNEPDPKECEDDEDHGGLNIWKMGVCKAIKPSESYYTIYHHGFKFKANVSFHHLSCADASLCNRDYFGSGGKILQPRKRKIQRSMLKQA